MVQKHPFAQQVAHEKDKVPSLIPYTEEQLIYIKSCCSGVFSEQEVVRGSER